MTTFPFDGFSSATIRFLADIRTQNNKAWFDRHKEDYEEHWLGAGQRFIAAVAPGLQKLAPGIHCVPKVNGSIFRLYRDTRFSKDKRPYKDHLDLWFWEGPERKQAVSGLFFRLTSDVIAVGVGAHQFAKEPLANYRARLADATSSKALLSAVRRLEKAGSQVQGEHYKRLPRDLASVTPALQGRREVLARHKALWAGFEEPISAIVHSAEVVDWCQQRWKKLLPLHRWLVDHVQ